MYIKILAYKSIQYLYYIVHFNLAYIKLICAARFEVAAIPAAERDGS